MVRPTKTLGQAVMAAREDGYAMAALLVALSVMAVAMTVAMPVWKQAAQREKESELVFRGEQYARAIGLFQRRTGPGVLPPSVDVLVDQHFLRRKYKDPVTGGDFLLIPGAVAAGTQAQLQAAQSANQSLGRSGSGTGSTTGASAASPYIAQGGPFGTTVPGGVTGVVSKSTDASIRLYNGRGHYNEWEFRYAAPPTAAPGGGNGAGGGGGTGGAGGRGDTGPGRGRGGQDGGRGGDGRGRGDTPNRGGGAPPQRGGSGAGPGGGFGGTGARGGTFGR